MTRKITTGVIAAVLLATMAVFAAEKVKEKVLAEKPKAGERGERFEWQEGLLDELADAYKANDREKMGEIINKMQERREKMREFAKANKWHKRAHRPMMGQMGPGWGPRQQMAGPGWNRSWGMQGRGWNQGGPMAGAGPRCGQFQAMRGRGFGCCGNMMGNCGPMAGGFGQKPCQQDGPWQMPGWGQGFRQNWMPGPGADNMGPQDWRPRREKSIPPPEWGW